MVLDQYSSRAFAGIIRFDTEGYWHQIAVYVNPNDLNPSLASSIYAKDR